MDRRSTGTLARRKRRDALTFALTWQRFEDHCGPGGDGGFGSINAVVVVVDCHGLTIHRIGPRIGVSQADLNVQKLGKRKGHKLESSFFRQRRVTEEIKLSHLNGMDAIRVSRCRHLAGRQRYSLVAEVEPTTAIDHHLEVICANRGIAAQLYTPPLHSKVRARVEVVD